VLQFAVARGASVYVTSSSQEKIDKAIQLGATNGVNYKEEGWEKKLLSQLPTGKRAFDAIIDGAGGDIIEKGTKILKVGPVFERLCSTDQTNKRQAGGVMSVYGMTVSPKMPFLMQTVLKNIDIKGSTMGSRKEFKDMVDFVKATNMRPVVSRVLKTDLDDIAGLDSLFEDMKSAKQFGKLVIEFGDSNGASKL